jgi:hypothetical protein
MACPARVKKQPTIDGLLCKVKKRRQRKRGARHCARQGQESAYGENWVAAWLARLGT